MVLLIRRILDWDENRASTKRGVTQQSLYFRIFVCSMGRVPVYQLPFMTPLALNTIGMTAVLAQLLPGHMYIELSWRGQKIFLHEAAAVSPGLLYECRRTSGRISTYDA